LGRGAAICIQQIFTNNESVPLEAVYKFPMPEGYAVCGFSIKAGDRVIEGEIEEYEKAFERYDDALAEGDGAYLLDEERPNIFTLSAGNINPGTSVTVTLKMVAMLECRGGTVRFMLPTTISPRYIPAGFDDGDDIPAENRVNPPVALDVPYGMSINLKIHDRDSVESIESPSHAIITNIGQDPISIAFSEDQVRMDRDFILNIKRSGAAHDRGYLFSREDDEFIQVDLDFELRSSERVQNSGDEIIFLLDCSGSMMGDSIERAKRAIEVLIRGLEQEKFFNIYRFGSTFEKLFPAPVAGSEENISKALDYIKKTDADLGGTEILSPMSDIYEAENAYTEGERNIVLITDGQVGNEAEIIGLSRRHADTRVFTVGIGYGPNEYFLREMARATGGSSELIAPGERIESKIVGLYERLVSESVRDIKVQLPEGAIQSPGEPVSFGGENITIFARLRSGRDVPKHLKITAKAGEDLIERDIDLQAVDSEECPIPLLWARERIRDLESEELVGGRGSRRNGRHKSRARNEIIEISREFGIISGETSFVAVEKRDEAEKTEDAAVLRRVPVMLTKGWGGSHVVHSFMAASPAQRYLSDGHIAMPRKADYTTAGQLSRAKFNMAFMSPSGRHQEPDILMEILSAQRPSGGFDINDELANMLGIDLDYLDEMAGKIEMNGDTDRLQLLLTGIILQILIDNFRDKSRLWKALLRKSIQWYARSKSSSSARLEGEKLNEWIRKYVAGLEMAADSV
jgi:Ca-activated chloride channel family protein